jgi:hypothetical protein
VRRKWRWLLGGVLALFALVLVIKAQRGESAPAPPASLALTTLRDAALAAAGPLAHWAAHKLAAPVAADLPVAQSAAAPGTQAAAPTTWDLCGVGHMPKPRAAAASAQETWLALPEPLGEQAIQVAAERTLAKLPNAGPRGQLLALLMQGADAAELAALARSSRDPVAMRWAVAKCSTSAQTACGGLSARDWVRLEPDNAAAWLTLWAAEPAADDEVMAGLRASTRHQTHQRSLSATLLEAVPADVPPYLQALLVAAVIGTEAAMQDSTGSQLLKRCKSPLLPGTAQQAQCEFVADLLTSCGDGWNDHLVGTALGKRLQWPKERIQALEAEHQAFVNAAMPWDADPQRWSCVQVEPMLAMQRDIPRLGEYAAWQRHMKP